jgi:hypothetical protein
MMAKKKCWRDISRTRLWVAILMGIIFAHRAAAKIQVVVDHVGYELQSPKQALGHRNQGRSRPIDLLTR